MLNTYVKEFLDDLQKVFLYIKIKLEILLILVKK